jgi:hypothetical protein
VALDERPRMLTFFDGLFLFCRILLILAAFAERKSHALDWR